MQRQLDAMAFTSYVGMQKELCGYYPHVNGNNLYEDCDLIILYKYCTMSPVKHDHNLGISVLLFWNCHQQHLFVSAGK